MPAALTLAQIAARLGGRVVGDPQTLIRQVASLQGAGPGNISFLGRPAFKSQLGTTRASAVVLNAAAETFTELPRIVCDNPYAYFARVSQLFNPLSTQPAGVHPTAVLAAGVKLGARVSVGAGCVLGDDVAIGDDSCLYPRVVVYPGCRIGARTIIHAGAVIGADGFGIAPEAGRWLKMPQIGGVAIGDDVEIGANTTIDRGAMDDTVIGDGVKLDNQIQIGHNCRIGAHSAMAGCSGIAGSSSLGERCMVGAGARILGHLTVCDDARVSAGTVVSRSIRKPGTYSGLFPVDEHAVWLRNAAAVRGLGKRSKPPRQAAAKPKARKEKGNG